MTTVLNFNILTVFLFLALCFFNIFVCEDLNDESIATLRAGELGVIKGVYVENIVEFRGLPYAIPPINERRWKIATMKTNLVNGNEEYFNATHYGSICPQKSSMSGKIHQSEDCLTLNIFAPKYVLLKESKLPVMVFIHGGAFVLGSNQDPFIDGKEICKRDVILVSINYRLGVFGFLAHPYLSKADPDHPSNFGLLDQKVALEWIHHYIKNFGGDPDNITIFGESAGAISTSYLISSSYHKSVGGKAPINKTPFKRAIMQSSPMSLLSITTEEVEVVGNLYIKSLGYSDDPSTKEAFDFLLSIDTETLLEATASFNDNRDIFWHAGFNLEFPKMTFIPTLDKNHFTESPIKIFGDDDAFSDEIDIMIGTTKDEGTMFVWFAFFLMDLTDEIYRSIIKNLFEDHIKFFRTHDSISDITQAIFDLYDSNPELTTPFETLSTIQGDMLFQCGSIEAAKNLKDKGHKNVYKYLFDHKPSTGLQSIGVYHASELPFVFGHAPGGFLFPSEFNQKERDLSNRIIDYWTTFAKYGEIENNKWVEFDENESTIVFTADGDYITTTYKQEECDFWHKIYPDAELNLFYSDALRDEPALSRFVNQHFKSVLLNRKLMGVIIKVVIFVAVAIFLSIIYCCCIKSKKTSKPKSSTTTKKTKTQ